MAALSTSVYRHFMKKVIEKIGRENYETAKKKREAMRHSHIIQTLATLDFMTYDEIFELIAEIVSEEGISNVIISSGLASELSFEGGSIYYSFPGNGAKTEVLPVFFPLEDARPQFLLRFDEYESLERYIKAFEKVGDVTELEITPKELVDLALKAGASDFHIIPKDDGYHVFFRVHGLYVEQKNLMLSRDHGSRFLSLMMIEASRETKGSFNPDERKVYQDARLVYDDLNCEVRLAFIPDGRTLEHGEVVGRIIRRTKIKGNKPLEEMLVELGYYPEDVEPWKVITRMEGVLAIVSGKTNSGKSTLITRVLSTIKDRKIVTVEDPVEYEIDSPNAMHHQIYEPKDESLRMDFVKYVKGFKRADTDVIFIGELREGSRGLMESVISAAYAGQLIFTTVHISSAFELYEFLETRFAEGSLKPDSIRHFAADKIAISFNQVLAPRLCPKCRKEAVFQITMDELYYTSLSESERRKLLEYKGEKVYTKGDGCDYCKGLGYVGRVPIYEYFVPDRDLRDKIREGVMPPYAIKEYVIKNRNEKGIKGVTKFEVFFRRLQEGEVEKNVVFLI